MPDPDGRGAKSTVAQTDRNKEPTPIRPKTASSKHDETASRKSINTQVLGHGETQA